MPEPERKLENYDRVLVVEGYSDLLFYAEMLEEVGKQDSVFIKDLGGRDGVRTKLDAFITPVLLNAKVAIGFLFDADANPQATTDSLQRLLSALTRQAVVNGQWTNGRPRIGLMVVPGPQSPGEIETLVWQSWSADPANAPQRACVDTYVNCMRGHGFTAHSPDKGLIGTLLAILSDEDPRLGPGARDNVFDLHSPQLQPLRNFLTAF